MLLYREIIHQRYVLVSKDGWDDYSIFWIAKDFAYDVYVRIRILKSKPMLAKMALQELQHHSELEKASQSTSWKQFIKKTGLRNTEERCTSKLLNIFMLNSTYGNYPCIIYDCCGVSLSKVLNCHFPSGVYRHLI